MKIILIAFILLVVTLGPLLAIWALNTLFPSLAISYTIETWAAAFILNGMLAARVSK